MTQSKNGISQPTGRRQFLKNLAFIASSSALAPISPSLRKAAGQNRIKKGEMYYRRLGRSGLLISEISLGGSPLPEDPIFYRAFERGVNYIDTSHNYMNGNSERKIGKLCRDVGRDKVLVATKFHIRDNWSEKAIISTVEGSLKRLQSDYIDVLLIHGVENEADLTDERIISSFTRLKKEGKYRFRGLSCHTNHDRILKRAVESGFYDMVQLAYNVFDIQRAEKEIKTYGDYLGESGIRGLLSLAHSHDMGIIAMKTLKVGGRRQNLDAYKKGSASIFQAMLKWVLENDHVTSAVTEMLTYQELEEDLGAVGNPLTPDERKDLYRFVAENAADYCHMCGRCSLSCPSRIETTTILRYLAYFESYAKERRAKEAYARLKPSQTALSCSTCGKCEEICPSRVRVRERIRLAHKILTDKKG